MTESGKLCLLAVEAHILADEASVRAIDAWFRAVKETGMSYEAVLKRGEEELRCLEAEEG